MKKFFKFGKKKGGGADGKSLSKASSEISLNGPGYAVREKDLGKLHKAAWIGDLDKVKQLAKKDASPLDKENRTPLHLACVKGHAAIVQELLEWRAKTNVGDSDSRTPLLKATQCHQLQCVQLLLDHRADPNTQDALGETSLHYAARDGVIMILEALLQCGNINIDIQNKSGQSSMMVAVHAQQVRSIKMLLENGADPDLQDMKGRTSLMLACAADDHEVTRLLLDSKASPIIKDKEGWTAYDLAEKDGHDNCLKVLARYTGQSGDAARKSSTQFNDSEDDDYDGEGAAAARPAPGRMNNGALRPPGDDIFGLPAQNEADDYSAAEDTASKVSDAGGNLDSWGDTDDDSEMEPKKKKPGSPMKAKPPAYEDILEVTETDLPAYNDLVEGQSIPNLDLSRVLRGSSNDLNKKPDNNKAPAAQKVVSPDVQRNPIVKNDRGPTASARSMASGASLEENTWSDNDDSLFSSGREKKPSLLRPPAAFNNSGPPPPIAPKPKLKSTSSVAEEDESKWSDSETSAIAGKLAAKPTFSTFMPIAANQKKDKDDDDDESSKWDSDSVDSLREEDSKSQGTKKTTDKKITNSNGMTAEKRKAVMADLGLSDVSDVSDPELSEEEDEEKPNIQCKKKHEDSDWDSTQASDINTPRGKARGPPMSARSAASEWDSTIDEEEEPPLPETTQKSPAVGKGSSLRHIHLLQRQKRREESDSDQSPSVNSNKKSDGVLKKSSENSDWDSDSQNKSVQSVKKVESAAKSDGEEDNSKWDSESGGGGDGNSNASKATRANSDAGRLPPDKAEKRDEDAVRKGSVESGKDSKWDSESLKSNPSGSQAKKMASQNVTHPGTSEQGSDWDSDVENDKVNSEQSVKLKKETAPKESNTKAGDSESESEYDDDVVNAAVEIALRKNSGPNNTEAVQQVATKEDRVTSQSESESEFDDNFINAAVEKAIDRKDSKPDLGSPAGDKNAKETTSGRAQASANSQSESESEFDDNFINAAVNKAIERKDSRPDMVGPAAVPAKQGVQVPDGDDSDKTLTESESEYGDDVVNAAVENALKRGSLKDEGVSNKPGPSQTKHAMSMNEDSDSDSVGGGYNNLVSKSVVKASLEPEIIDNLANERRESVPSPGSSFNAAGKVENVSKTTTAAIKTTRPLLPTTVNEEMGNDSSLSLSVSDDEDQNIPITALKFASKTNKNDGPVQDDKEQLQDSWDEDDSDENPSLQEVKQQENKGQESQLEEKPVEVDDIRPPSQTPNASAQMESRSFLSPPPEFKNTFEVLHDDIEIEQDSDVVQEFVNLSDDDSESHDGPPPPSIPDSAARNTLSLADELRECSVPLVGLQVIKSKTIEEEDEDEDSKWDSEEALPLSDNNKPVSLKISATTAAVKPNVVGGMNIEVSDEEEEEEEESEWEREKRLKDEQKKVEEERLKKRNDDFEKKQEELRREAQEELRREKEETERLRKEQEERARRELEETRKREERLQEERREQERKEEERRKEQMRLEHERQEELRKKEEIATKERERIEAEIRASVTCPSVNKQPKKEGPAVPPKPRGIFTPSPRANPPPSPRLNNKLQSDDDDDDTFNNDQIPDIGSPGRPTDAMVGPPVGVSVLPPSGLMRQVVNGGGPYMNGDSVRDEDDDCFSYSSTEQDVSDHGGLHSLGMGNNANLSFGSDSMSVLRQQEQLRETRRLLDKERSSRLTIENKKRHVESERSEIVQKLEDVTHSKSSLEQEKINLEAKIRALDYKLSEEEAKRKNAETLYNKTKEQLTRKEDQYSIEAEAKQKAELNMRNIQMELRQSLGNVKQLEDEKEDLGRQLQHEKSARLLQEQINEELTNFQKALTDSKVSDKHLQDEMTEIMSKFEEADENRKHAQDSVEKMKAEMYALKMELERQRNRARDDHNLLSSENEDLVSKIEDLKADLKLNEDALNQATMHYNVNMSQVKIENTRVMNSWEKDREAREKLESEVQSLNARLEASTKELKSLQDARSDLERKNHRSYEELTKVLERREREATELKEAKETMQQKLSASEAKLNMNENELHIVNATLAERTSQVATLQQDLDHRKSSFETLDENYRKEKEDSVRYQARLETMQEKLSSLQHEVLTLRQQNDDLRTQNIGKDQKETHDKVSAMLHSLREEHEKARITLEEKNANLSHTVLQLKDNLRENGSRKLSEDQEFRQLQIEVKDANKELSKAQASLEIANKTKEHLETERQNLKAEVERLQNRLEASQQKQMELHTELVHVTNRLEKAEHSSAFTSQQLDRHTATAEADAKFREDYIHQIHQLELAKTKLESSLTHEGDKVNMLQRELQDANQMRQVVESYASKLKDLKADLEDKLSTLDSLQEQVALLRSSNAELQRHAENATAAQTQASNEAQDSKGLWEAEVKARSKIGLRIAQLEREKQEVLALVEEEKKKTRKAMELKKVAEAKLTGEEGRIQQFQKEINNLKLHLKSAKKKLKVSKDNVVNAMQSEYNQDRLDMERAVSALRQQLDEVTHQLTSESSRRADLETKNKQAQMELNSLRGLDKNFVRLEKGKRKVEEEFALYKAHVASNYTEKTKLEMARAELEAQARMELNKKLEEVNKYLEQQAEARERIDQMRDMKETDMRREFEKAKKDLRDEINRLKNNFNDNQARKDIFDLEVQKYREMYDNEVKLRERLAEKLEKASERASQAQLFLERQKLQPPPNSYGSPFLNGILSPPRSHGLNDSLVYQLRAELDRSIHKHLEKGPSIDISVPSTSSKNATGMAATFEKSAQEYLNVLKSSYAIS